TGRADVADHLALADFSAFAHARRDAAHVGVGGAVFRPVLEDDLVAVAAAVAGEIDDTVGDRADRGAGRGGVVDALVRLPLARDRVHAHREARGNARELQRRFQEGLFQRLAVQAV